MTTLATRVVVVVALLLLAVAAPAVALRTPVTAGSTVCFFEEVPGNTALLVRGKLLCGERACDGAANANALSVTITDPSGAEVVSQRGLGQGGRIAITTQRAGEHTICYATTPATTATHVEIDLDAGVYATDYDQLAKDEHLSELEVQIRRLSDRVRGIQREQKFFMAKEAEFAEENERINAGVMWWSLGQTLLLLAAGMWQIQHLKKFFQAKKVM